MHSRLRPWLIAFHPERCGISTVQAQKCVEEAMQILDDLVMLKPVTNINDCLLPESHPYLASVLADLQATAASRKEDDPNWREKFLEALQESGIPRSRCVVPTELWKLPLRAVLRLGAYL